MTRTNLIVVSPIDYVQLVWIELSTMSSFLATISWIDCNYLTPSVVSTHVTNPMRRLDGPALRAHGPRGHTQRKVTLVFTFSWHGPFLLRQCAHNYSPMNSFLFEWPFKWFPCIGYVVIATVTNVVVLIGSAKWTNANTINSTERLRWQCQDSWLSNSLSDVQYMVSVDSEIRVNVFRG